MKGAERWNSVRTGTPVLELDNARISYFTRAGEINVVPDVSFRLMQGEAHRPGRRVRLRQVDDRLRRHELSRAAPGGSPAGASSSRAATWRGMSAEELRLVRGGAHGHGLPGPDVAASIRSCTIGRQLMEVPIIHQNAGAEAARERALQMLREVNLPDPESVFDRYPHQLSGGQQQRVVIAMALMAEPSLLIMDEPTTGLDVTVEAAVLDLVRELRKRHNTAILFISHNLGTVVRICDRIGVMYAGELVEEGPIRDVFRDPRHPYTRGLLDCIPVLGSDKHSRRWRRSPGRCRSALARPKGCVFSTALPLCRGRPLHHRARFRSCRSPSETGPSRAMRTPCRASATARAALGGDRPPHAAAARGHASSASSGCSKIYRQSAGMFDGGGGYDVQAAERSISVSAARGTTLAIVGESGCGKSTLAKVLTGLERATDGKVRAGRGGDRRAPRSRTAPTGTKRKLQMVFQNPDSTLNPSHSVGYRDRPRPCKRLQGHQRRAMRRRRCSVCSRPSSCRSSSPSASRASSPAARSSASPSPGRWPATPSS